MHSGRDIAFQLRIVADDFHRAPAQNERGADNKGVAHIFGHSKRLIARAGGAVVRLFQAQFVQQLLKTFAVFGQVNRIGRCAQDRDAFVGQCLRQLQRRLAAELHDHPVQRAVFLFDAQNFQNMFQRQRFEIQAVRGVIIGRHGFGVAVHHDGFIARSRQRIAGVAAAIVKLNPLSDPVRATAKDDDFLGVGRTRFAFHIAHRGGLVGGIHIRRLRFKLGGTGVDPLEDGVDAQIAAGTADLRFVTAGQFGKAGIGKAHHLQLANAVRGDGQARFCDFRFNVHNLADPGKEPRIERGDGVDLVICQAVAHGLGDVAQTVGGGFGQGLGDGHTVRCTGDGYFVKARQARL